jgi:hypothetical protein
MSCNICCEKFNKSLHLKITCPYEDCAFEACKTCTRQYLLSTSSDPHCMDCRKAWSEKFVIENTNRSFYDNEYKKHRKQLLLEVEMSKMPETMQLAANHNMIKEHEAEITKYSNEIKEHQTRINELKRLRVPHYNAIYNLRHGGRGGGDDGADGFKDKTRKFIMACPNNDCRGYLSTAYKCELCDLHTCQDCLEIIGHHKTDEHECNPDSIKSAELIRKDTHPCPTCGTRIFKISGCDQMWCTECHVAFSWKTGKIDKGPVHNPEFYKFQSTLNGGAGGVAPRNPGDILCGGICTYYTFQHRILRKLDFITVKVKREALTEYISRFHRFATHINNYDLVGMRQRVRNLSDHKDVRIQYINNEKTKEELATIVFRHDTMRKKYTEILHIYELLSVVATETFASLSNSSNVGEDFSNEVHDALAHYWKLREYCNEQLAEISRVYNHCVLQIDDMFTMRNSKFSFDTNKKTKAKAKAQNDDKSKDKDKDKDKGKGKGKGKGKAKMDVDKELSAGASAGSSSDPLP